MHLFCLLLLCTSPLPIPHLCIPRILLALTIFTDLIACMQSAALRPYVLLPLRIRHAGRSQLVPARPCTPSIWYRQRGRSAQELRHGTHDSGAEAQALTGRPAGRCKRWAGFRSVRVLRRGARGLAPGPRLLAEHVQARFELSLQGQN
jgi:hypothetical protein